MYLPPLEPIANNEIRVLGDVQIDPSAVLAPGTVLQAATNCKIIIGADVCIGMGTIVSAISGSIEIESGAILGAGVLIVGNSKIGRNACIGSSTTIYNASIEKMRVVSSGSLIGDTSRQISDRDLVEKVEPSPNQNGFQTNGEASPTSSQVENLSATSTETESFWFDSESASVEEVEDISPTEDKTNPNGSLSKTSENSNSKERKASQVYINQLLITLLPHRQASNNNHSKNSE